MNTKPKILLVTGAIALGTLSVVVSANAIVKDGLPVSANGESGAKRTLTVNRDNRQLGHYINLGGKTPEDKTWSTVTYNMKDNQAYGFISTSQGQDSISYENNAVFALWYNDFVPCYFQINDGDYDNNIISFETPQTNPLTIVKYRHLTQIDFVLDKGNKTSSDCVLELRASIGTITKTGESAYAEENCVYLTWTPNNAEGYITGETDVTFRPLSETATGGAI